MPDAKQMPRCMFRNFRILGHVLIDNFSCDDCSNWWEHIRFDPFSESISK